MMRLAVANGCQAREKQLNGSAGKQILISLQLCRRENINDDDLVAIYIDL